MFFLSCVCYAFVRVCLFVPCGHLLGKDWPLGSRLWCLTVSLSLSHWYPGQVWNLIVSIPDLCTLTLLSLSSWCLVVVVWLFFGMPWVCLPFVIVVFTDHTHIFVLDSTQVGKSFIKSALWSPAGKGLTSWLLFVMFNCVFVTFQCGILGQV